MSWGVRCAETTRTSCGTPRSVSTSAAAPITGRSLSLPITMPTSGPPGSLTAPPPRPRAGRASSASSAVAPSAVTWPILRPGPHLRLVVEVQVGALDGEGRGHVAARAGPARRAEQVHHRRGGRAHAHLAERQVQHAAQVVLELRRLARLDGVVAGVVGAGRQLVHQDAAVVRQEHLHPRHAQAVGRGGGRRRNLARPGERVAVDRRGRHDLVAHVVALHRLHHGVAPHLRPRASAPPSPPAPSRTGPSPPPARPPRRRAGRTRRGPRPRRGRWRCRSRRSRACGPSASAASPGRGRRRPGRRGAPPPATVPSAGRRRATGPSGAPCPAPARAPPDGAAPACRQRRPRRARRRRRTRSRASPPRRRRRAPGPPPRPSSRPPPRTPPSGPPARRGGPAPPPGCRAATPPGTSCGRAARRRRCPRRRARPASRPRAVGRRGAGTRSRAGRYRRASGDRNFPPALPREARSQRPVRGAASAGGLYAIPSHRPNRGLTSSADRADRVAMAMLAMDVPPPQTAPAVPARMLAFADEFRFNTSRDAVPAGTLILQVKNIGEDDHDLRIMGPNGVARAETGVVKPGDLGQIRDPPAAGPLHVPLHRRRPRRAGHGRHAGGAGRQEEERPRR